MPDTDTLTWTDEPPTEPGFYWAEHKIRGDRRMSRIWVDEDQIWRIQHHGTDMPWRLRDEDFALRYYGPIPEPSEPDSE